MIQVILAILVVHNLISYKEAKFLYNHFKDKPVKYGLDEVIKSYEQAREQYKKNEGK